MCERSALSALSFRDAESCSLRKEIHPKIDEGWMRDQANQSNEDGAGSRATDTSLSTRYADCPAPKATLARAAAVRALREHCEHVTLSSPSRS